MDDLACPYRFDVQKNAISETATCGFIQNLTMLDAACCTVDRSACELCLQQSPFAPPQLNSVMPSLMVGACETAGELEAGSAAEVLFSWASSAVAAQSMPCLIPGTVACDIVMVCKATDDIAATVESVFGQEGAFVVLHLVAHGEGAISVIEPYSTRAGVRTHHFDNCHSTWACIQSVIPFLESPWIAIQTPTSVSEPRRVSEAVSTLRDNRAELFAAAVSMDGQTLASRKPDETKYSSSLQFSTLVMRRSSFTDLGGFDTTRTDGDLELFFRAACEGRKIELSDEPLVKEIAPLQQTHLDTTPVYGKFVDLQAQIADSAQTTADALAAETPEGHPPTKLYRPSLRHFATGFPRESAQCDVILPFRDDLDFVRESMNGLLQQENAEIVIHLVDDASHGETDDLFEQYGNLPNVRLYRNKINLGPFATFNNVSEFAETDFVAVQDADDISLPNRISTSVHLLRAADGDLLGACTELFGDEQLVLEIARERRINSSGDIHFVRNSRYPDPRTTGYFLENPTLTMKLDSFRQLGGYADFGEGRRNRTGVDTELQVRAHFSKAHIVVTNDILVRYRCHGSSATNHAASGFGSAAQVESHAELARRVLHYATGSFNPKWFGALGRHIGITEKLN